MTARTGSALIPVGGCATAATRFADVSTLGSATVKGIGPVLTDLACRRRAVLQAGGAIAAQRWLDRSPISVVADNLEQFRDGGSSRAIRASTVGGGPVLRRLLTLRNEVHNTTLVVHR